MKKTEKEKENICKFLSCCFIYFFFFISSLSFYFPFPVPFSRFFSRFFSRSFFPFFPLILFVFLLHFFISSFLHFFISSFLYFISFRINVDIMQPQQQFYISVDVGTKNLAVSIFLIAGRNVKVIDTALINIFTQ